MGVTGHMTISVSLQNDMGPLDIYAGGPHSSLAHYISLNARPEGPRAVVGWIAREGFWGGSSEPPTQPSIESGERSSTGVRPTANALWAHLRAQKTHLSAADSN